MIVSSDPAGGPWIHQGLHTGSANVQLIAQRLKRSRGFTEIVSPSRGQNHPQGCLGVACQGKGTGTKTWIVPPDTHTHTHTHTYMHTPRRPVAAIRSLPGNAGLRTLNNPIPGSYSAAAHSVYAFGWPRRSGATSPLVWK